MVSERNAHCMDVPEQGQERKMCIMQDVIKHRLDGLQP